MSTTLTRFSANRQESHPFSTEKAMQIEASFVILMNKSVREMKNYAGYPCKIKMAGQIINSAV